MPVLPIFSTYSHILSLYLAHRFKATNILGSDMEFAQLKNKAEILRNAVDPKAADMAVMVDSTVSGWSFKFTVDNYLVPVLFGSYYPNPAYIALSGPHTPPVAEDLFTLEYVPCLFVACVF